jgi:23S rRNA pseudouridine1911/1915/1917 synthase
MTGEEALIRICAETTDAGSRLDLFLTKKLPPFSRAQIAKLIKGGHVTAKEAPIKAAQLILGHENFWISLPKKELGGIIPKLLPLEIVFSDEHIAVINKPSGLAVHPGAGIQTDTLCNALLYHFPDIHIGHTLRPGIVHRLDKDTSGLMVVAKNDVAHRILSDDFKHHRIKKRYRAFCFGEIDLDRFSLITGHVRHPYNRLRFFTGIPVPKKPTKNLRLAHTDIEVLRRRFGMSEVCAYLHTGRTHQIRAHLADRGYPLLGDKLYGGRRSLSPTIPQELHLAIASLKGQALHAEGLEFKHPLTKSSLDFNVPLPKDLALLSHIFQT